MFGTKLRLSRQNKGLTQQNMGDHLGITAVGYAKYEKETSEPNLANLKLICEKLEVSADWLLGLDTEPEVQTEGDLLQHLIALKNSGASVSDSLLLFKDAKKPMRDDNPRALFEIVDNDGKTKWITSDTFAEVQRGVIIVIKSDYLNSTFDTLQILENTLKKSERPQTNVIENFINGQIEFLKDKPLTQKTDPKIAFNISQLWKEHLWETHASIPGQNK